MPFSFTITHKDPNSYARTGRYETPHGTIETPNFIFCGTKASVKGLSPQQLREAGSDIILSNTYHLMLSPGPDLIAAMGGLHKFMSWDGPMFTDSGGFQIFSLGHGGVADEIKGRPQGHVRPKSILKITEEGAAFRSYVDGKHFFLTPESAVDIQRKLGADLIVQLDECTPFHVDKSYTEKSMAMSMRWGDRSLAEWKRGDDGKQKRAAFILTCAKSHANTPPAATSSQPPSAAPSARIKSRCMKLSPCAPPGFTRSVRCICSASAASSTYFQTCVQVLILSIACPRRESPATAGPW